MSPMQFLVTLHCMSTSPELLKPFLSYVPASPAGTMRSVLMSIIEHRKLSECCTSTNICCCWFFLRIPVM